MLPYYQFMVYHIGPITLQVWGTFVALGIAVAIFLGFRECKRRKLDPDSFLSIALWVIIAAIILSRLLYVAVFWKDYASNPWGVFEIWNGGMVAYGGIIGGVLAVLIYTRIKKLDLLSYLDIVALVFPAGFAIGRIGCHLIRDHMGKITHLPWGFIVSPGVARHDTAVYSILEGILLFAIFWPLRKKNLRKGTFILWVSLAYAVTRFFIDFLRADDLPGSDPRYFGLTLSQYISVLIFLACVFVLLWVLAQRKKQKNTEIHP